LINWLIYLLTDLVFHTLLATLFTLKNETNNGQLNLSLNLITCGLCCAAVSNSNYIESNGPMIGEQWIGHNKKGNGYGLIGVQCRHTPEGTEESDGKHNYS
jgi:hypothetical protein